MTKHIQFLRNSEVYASRELAITGLETQLANLLDGEIVLSRYTLEGETKSLVAVIQKTADGVTTYTIIDTDAIPSEVDSALTELEQTLKDKIEEITVHNTDGSISVVTAETGTTISVRIDPTDQFNTVSTNGVKTNINLTWSSDDGLKLLGKDGAEIATIQASDFIKDGMLEDVTLEENPTGQTAGTYLHFIFNADGGGKEIYLNVTDLIDIYEGSTSIQVSDKVISVIRDASSEAFFYSGANGIGVSGVTDAINTAVDTASGNLQSLIDTHEASIGLNDTGGHITTTGNYTSGATTIAGEISLLDAQVKANYDTILENEEIAAQAITALATACGVLDGEEVKYVAPTVSGVFTDTTSIMSMLNKIDAEWNTIDCGQY